MLTAIAGSDISPGDIFVSTSDDGTVVEAVCPYGQCRHDPHRERQMSVHVAGQTMHGIRHEWFVAVDPTRPLLVQRP